MAVCLKSLTFERIFKIKKMNVLCKLPVKIFLGCLLVAFMVSCSDNNDEYNSKLPVYSGVTLTPSTVKRGQEVTATVTRASKGKYLYDAKYTWEISDADSLVVTSEQGSTYTITDPVKEKQDPYISFMAPALPGSYTLKLTVTYKVSGSGRNQSSQNYEIQDGTVTGYLSALYGQSIVTRKITVR